MTVSITAAAGGQTSVGKKIAVATTGIIGVGFVFAHMVGNLKVFLGREQINHYGEFLRDMGEPIFPRSMVLWGMRLVLIAAVAIHITLTAQLALQSRRARPVRYQHTKPVRAGAANAAARTMRWGGIAILLFLIFHLADFTWGTINPGFERGDVYRNLVASFQRVPVTVVYLAALFALGMHLYHGTWSVCQTLGVNQSRWDKTIRRGATLLAVVIAGGYAIVPLSVVFGLVD